MIDFIVIFSYFFIIIVFILLLIIINIQSSENKIKLKSKPPKIDYISTFNDSMNKFLSDSKSIKDKLDNI